MSSDSPNPRRLTIVLIILMLLVPIFTVDIGDAKYEALQIGDVSNHDLRADRSFVVVDEQKTQQLQRKAVESIPPIFFVDMQLRQGLLDVVEGFILVHGDCIAANRSVTGTPSDVRVDDMFGSWANLQARVKLVCP